MAGVSASVSLPLHHEVQKFSFSYGTSSPGWSRRKGHKTDVVVTFCTVLDVPHVLVLLICAAVEVFCRQNACSRVKRWMSICTNVRFVGRVTDIL